MHEFELGVFKAFFIHLLRILEAHNPLCLVELDKRSAYSSFALRDAYVIHSFRLVPTFGRWTVRKFPESVSALKKLAAWNYEFEIERLQCAIPVVDGLLPEPYNSDVLDALFTLAEWHALGKLRMHTDTTIEMLRTSTKELGRLLRRFRDHVCPFFKTKELPTEERTRERAQARNKSKGKGKGNATTKSTTTNAGTTKKEYNMFTYKLHALGHYVASILWFGTSDSYSTQPVSVYFYITNYRLPILSGRARTSKSKAFLRAHQQKQRCQTDDSSGET
ncbi:hypothetical protein C8F01DRAFT_1002225 [Mycena amicta]|nr:hypothetical protein C8F01DRAFT_1002225 [Mycena amicta]